MAKPSDFERIILKALFVNEGVRSKVLPMLSCDWFFDVDDKMIADRILDYNTRFGRLPNVIEMKRLITDEATLKIFEETMAIPDEEVNTEFILEEIEEYVRRRLLYNQAVKITSYVTNGTSNTDGKSECFADNVSDAESFSFDTNIGFDFFNDPQRLYEDANIHEKIYNCGVDTLNDMIGGGFHEKSLTLIMAGTNVGKTLIMCSLAKNFVMNGHNVLYVTFEDPENKIASRVAQNMFDITQRQYRQMTKENFAKAFQVAKSKLHGNRLVIKEFPEYSTNAMKIRSLIKELDEKQGFKPDVLFIDYIGCMVPNGRFNPNMNSNTLLLTVAMQVRALGMELGIPVISASQANRGGNGVAEIALTDVADSFGQNMKADAVFGVTQPDEMKEQNLYIVKLLKTRYGAPLNGRPILTRIGVDTEKQRIYDIDIADQNNQASNIFTTPSPTVGKKKTSFHEEEDEPYTFEEGNAVADDEIDYQ